MGNNKYSELVHYTQSNFIQPATNFTLVVRQDPNQTNFDEYGYLHNNLTHDHTIKHA